MKDILSHRILRRMNFISDQSGILNRYINESENWNPHLENTKKYIVDFIERNGFKTLTILGSGWLLDLPVEYLARHTQKVYLYDIYHPPQILHKLKNFECFSFVNQDITGNLISQVYKAVKQYRKTGEKIDIENFLFCGFSPIDETEAYISLNILNQLDILIVDFLKDEEIYSEKEIEFLRANIQKSHINSLPANKSCLITDYEELISTFDNTQESKKNLLYTNLPVGKNIHKWSWVFDTNGNYNINHKTTLNVIAFEI